jgi:hypothetical protein
VTACIRDFGERFVPGYKAMSTVDVLMNAPFDESRRTASGE